MNDILAAYMDKLVDRTQHHLGYPYNLDFDYGALEKLVKFSINNLGDPFIESNYGVHSREFEVRVDACSNVQITHAELPACFMLHQTWMGLAQQRRTAVRSHIHITMPMLRLAILHTEHNHTHHFAASFGPRSSLWHAASLIHRLAC